MIRILLLLSITLNAYSFEAIPLTIAQSDTSLKLNLSSPIGIPAKSKANIGKVSRKKINSEILNIAIFIIGADKESFKWLEEHQQELKTMQAIGFITNIDNFESLITLQEKFNLPLLPVNIDPLLDYINEKHYPLIIAEGFVWQ